jgi:predicted polyphosphate/ATP-dependent NAD kinase
MEHRERILVGILTNPASGRDIRRLVSCASLFPTSEKVSIGNQSHRCVGALGVDEVFLMPDHSGIAGGVLRAVRSHAARATDRWPEVRFIFQEVEQTANDTRRAVCAMLAQGVRTIAVLGGDGTHRVVASECGSIPLVTLSTGTNNVFPDLREATVAGMAAALCATGMIDHQSICRRNKRLNGEREIEFGPDEFPLVWLDPEGPMTVNVRRTLDLAAGEGLLRKRPALLQ